VKGAHAWTITAAMHTERNASRSKRKKRMMENGVQLAVSDVLSCTQYPGRHNTPLDSKKKKRVVHISYHRRSPPSSQIVQNGSPSSSSS
jgi:hypothetical protein